MAKIVWTPEKSEMGLGSVILETPTSPLTLDGYRGLLMGRISRMIRRTDPEEAEGLLLKTLGAVENLWMPGQDLGDAPELLVWDSETLMERSGMMGQAFPVPLARISPRRDLTPEDFEEESLEEYLFVLFNGMM